MTSNQIESSEVRRANARIGIALGSGSARGWAHIGILRALAEMGVELGIVAGCSIGAIVGAAYASSRVDALEAWCRSLTWKQIAGFLDLSLTGGGLVQGESLMQFVRDQVGDPSIESLDRKFGMVATDLDSGREIWFRDGSLLDGVRASIAVPGLFTPVKLHGRWLVDGGLTNPVPVSLCRAMGAEIVIAVDLNADIVGKHGRKRAGHGEKSGAEDSADARFFKRVSVQLRNSLSERKNTLFSQVFGESLDTPGIFEVVASSLNIMQDRITRSRMAGDAPEIILAPRLSQLGLMEFDQAAIAIDEGHACVTRMRPMLDQVLSDL